jgi:hypothetical protein
MSSAAVRGRSPIRRRALASCSSPRLEDLGLGRLFGAAGASSSHAEEHPAAAPTALTAGGSAAVRAERDLIVTITGQPALATGLTILEGGLG